MEQWNALPKQTQMASPINVVPSKFPTSISIPFGQIPPIQIPQLPTAGPVSSQILQAQQVQGVPVVPCNATPSDPTPTLEPIATMQPMPDHALVGALQELSLANLPSDSKTESNEDSAAESNNSIEADNYSAGTIEFDTCFATGCNIAGQVAMRNQHRPCFRGIFNACHRTGIEIISPRQTAAHIHSQGVPWATKDFINTYLHLVNSRHLIKGYLQVPVGSLSSIEHEFTADFRTSFARWETASRNLSEHIIRIFSNLDSNLSNPAPLPACLNQHMRTDDLGAINHIASRAVAEDPEVSGQAKSAHPATSRHPATTFADVPLYTILDAQDLSDAERDWAIVLAACNQFMQTNSTIEEDFNTGPDWHSWSQQDRICTAPEAEAPAEVAEEATEDELDVQHARQMFLQQQIHQWHAQRQGTLVEFGKHTTREELINSHTLRDTANPRRFCSERDQQLMEALLVEIVKSDLYQILPQHHMQNAGLVECWEELNSVFAKCYKSIGEMTYDIRRILIKTQLYSMTDPVISIYIERLRSTINI